jgi:hypothetical protein
VADQFPEIFRQLKDQYVKWSKSVDASVAGKDYPEKMLTDPGKNIQWKDDPLYAPYLDAWKSRPEYSNLLR